MSDERWEKIKDVVARALERPEGERRAFLDEACASDATLRDEVESLLSYDDDEAFLEAPTAHGMALESGKRLGPYEILAAIGAGGMGEVYRARDTRLDRIVAIKILPQHLADEPQLRQRLEREARAISQLNHPHICTLHDIGEQDGVDFLVMEFIEGETMAQRLTAGPLPVNEALEYGRQIADGLSKAHSAGIVHRDLKPANVMLTPSGVKLLDFGVAKQVVSEVVQTTTLTGWTRVAPKTGEARDALTQQGIVLGTARYMSPEQASGLRVDHLSDQYSFGVVLYEMLCAHKQPDIDTMTEVLAGVMCEDRTVPREHRSELTALIEQVVSRCLCQEPSGRYPSTDELRAALRRCARLCSTDYRRGQIHWRRAGAGMAAVAIAAGVGAWYVLHDDILRWLERDTLAQIEQLSEAGDLGAAFRLVREVHEKLPDDPAVQKMLDRITIPVSIVTEPAGAQVLMQDYASNDTPWVELGETPLDNERIPYALMRWKIVKDGYVDFEGAPFGARPFAAFAQGFRLVSESSRPAGMVRIPGGPYQRINFGPVQLGDYWLDKYEVTNRQFKDFIEGGGYRTVDHWGESFAQSGGDLPRDEALATFVDSTGQPGPAGWQLGTYARDQAEHPVRGVSWYEASAYCRSVGKSLPSLYHWSGATIQDQFSDIVQVSNFGGKGPAPVGRHAGLGDFGTYDMAGNVREWVWNRGQTGRYILGGAWNEPTYLFRLDAAEESPLSRHRTNGFRCARYIDPVAPALLARVTRSYQEDPQEPVNDEIFDVYRRIYAYDRTELDATIDAVDDSAPHWRRVTASFNAAYGGERVIVHMLLPRNVEPPYQAVVWVPGNDVFFLPEGAALASEFLFDFVPRTGRALIYPVYKGTYERRVPFSFAPNEWRDLIVVWSKDLGRTLDYLDERTDIDTSKVAYYGFSSGAYYGPIYTAIDDRFKASILLAAGMYRIMPPEADANNFAGRTKVPTLMINGRDDFLSPYESSQKPFFEMLGAAQADKRHARLPGGHIVSDRAALIEEVRVWLDRYLGPT